MLVSDKRNRASQSPDKWSSHTVWDIQDLRLKKNGLEITVHILSVNMKMHLYKFKDKIKF